MQRNRSNKPVRLGAMAPTRNRTADAPTFQQVLTKHGLLPRGASIAEAWQLWQEVFDLRAQRRSRTRRGPKLPFPSEPEMEQLAATYHSVISLILALADQASSDKKIDHSNFVKNALVKAWKQNEELKKAVVKETSGWETRMDKVRGWFRDVLKEDDTYKRYLNEEDPNEEAQKAFIKHLSRKIILGNGTINDYFEEQNIRWAEDKDIIKSMMDKTIKSYADEKITLQKVSLNWDDDLEFIDRLFNNAVDLDPQYKELIAKNTRNWEVDRLPLTDRVILEMAISEMIHFPNIPVKVTINEYIELSKDYSTPKSRQFINGILDVISKAMKESGAVKKSGRGLLDNK